MGWIAAPALAALAVIGCLSPDNPLDTETLTELQKTNCDDVTSTYENFGQSFFQEFCLRCHSSTLGNDLARNDAPLGINFDNISGIRNFATRIRIRAGILGDMPPAVLSTHEQRPTKEQRLALIKWLDCDVSGR